MINPDLTTLQYTRTHAHSVSHTDTYTASRRAVPRNWTLVKRIKEDHGQVLFGLAVNLYDERWKNLFATTGANRCTVYELLPDGNVDVRQVERYRASERASERESERVG